MKQKIITSSAITIAIILLTGLIYLMSNKSAIAPTNQANQESPNFQGKEQILQNALNLYIQKKEAGLDMSDGPCLGEVEKDWVLDIAHNPRTSKDDDPKNQCDEFKNGTAHHFIELDENGQLIRAI